MFLIFLLLLNQFVTVPPSYKGISLSSNMGNTVREDDPALLECIVPYLKPDATVLSLVSDIQTWDLQISSYLNDDKKTYYASGNTSITFSRYDNGRTDLKCMVIWEAEVYESEPQVLEVHCKYLMYIFQVSNI